MKDCGKTQLNKGAQLRGDTFKVLLSNQANGPEVNNTIEEEAGCVRARACTCHPLSDELRPLALKRLEVRRSSLIRTRRQVAVGDGLKTLGIC